MALDSLTRAPLRWSTLAGLEREVTAKRIARPDGQIRGQDMLGEQRPVSDEHIHWHGASSLCSREPP
eukprot:4817652-Alexandrium_andersonii.AAC.1